MLPTPELLRELLDYDPATGCLAWKKRTAAHFSAKSPQKADAAARSFNERHAGKRALIQPRTGYLAGIILRRTLYAHRVAWAIVYGVWPEGQIDHINRNRTDNRIGNLRCVDRYENMRNQPPKKNNTSGVTGVCRGRQGRWQAYIRDGDKHIRLGEFTNKQDAIFARLEAERRLNYHPNHGRATRGD